MEIPTTVKVRGRYHQVTVSARGYVRVGSELCDMQELFPSDDEWLAFKAANDRAAWQEKMTTCYETALARLRETERKK
jgi:hypothetical protein